MNRTRISALLPIVTTAAVLTLGACSSGGADDSGANDSGGGGAPLAATEAEVPGDVVEGAAPDQAADRAGAATGSADGKARPATRVQRAVISKGTVELRADDVARARFDIGKVVDRFGGEVAEEDTQTDRDGEVAYSRLVLRVPAESFTDAMDELKTIGKLVNDSRKSTDATTQVIDTEVRVRAQRLSIRRIQALLSRADTIGDIVSIESQLAQREAELQSLEQQQAFLADQTTLSTITVSLERTPEKQEKEEPGGEESGFLAGLDAGWDALRTFGSGVATVAGALLPWLALLGLLGTPLLLALRRFRRPAATPTP